MVIWMAAAVKMGAGGTVAAAAAPVTLPTLGAGR